MQSRSPGTKEPGHIWTKASPPQCPQRKRESAESFVFQRLWCAFEASVDLRGHLCWKRSFFWAHGDVMLRVGFLPCLGPCKHPAPDQDSQTLRAVQTAKTAQTIPNTQISQSFQASQPRNCCSAHRFAAVRSAEWRCRSTCWPLRSRFPKSKFTQALKAKCQQ